MNGIKDNLRVESIMDKELTSGKMGKLIQDILTKKNLMEKAV